MKRFAILALVLLVLAAVPGALAAETRIKPAFDVPEYVQWVLDIASQEVGYREGAHGYTKYGEWAGDPYAQWCAEFLDWCVDQADQQHGTQLLNSVWPRYSGSNTGRSWFIREGRYIVRWGNLEGWGYQWLKGESEFITTGSYIPQPGDWVFFTWTNTQDTDHVAMVEYCTRDDSGAVSIHVIEGNTPAEVKRTVYALDYGRILGFGTVHDAADWTLRFGNRGEKVRQLQEKLIRLGFLAEGRQDGTFGNATAEAVRAFQKSEGIRQTGIANIQTQLAMDEAVEQAIYNDPNTWLVTDSEGDDGGLDDLLDFDSFAMPTDAASAAGDDETEFSLAEGEAMEDDSVEAEIEDALPDWIGQ